LGKAAPEGQKVEHSNFKEAHSGIHEDEIHKRRKNDGCTRCGIPSHRWKNCRKPIQVSTIGRRKVDPATRGNFVPSSNREDHRSLPWLIEARKEIHIKSIGLSGPGCGIRIWTRPRMSQWHHWQRQVGSSNTSSRIEKH